MGVVVVGPGDTGGGVPVPRCVVGGSPTMWENPLKYEDSGGPGSLYRS